MFCSRWCVLSYFAILEGSNTHLKKKKGSTERRIGAREQLSGVSHFPMFHQWIYHQHATVVSFLSLCSSPTMMFWCGYTHTYRSLTIAAKGTNNQRHTHVLTFIILFMSVKRFGKYMLFFSLASVRFLSLTPRSISNFSFGQATVDESNE